MENTDITIRCAEVRDYMQISGICRTSLGYECSPELVKKRLTGLDGRRERVFAAVCDDIVIGFVHAEKYETLYYDTLVNILGIAVSNEHKKKGIGRRLMQEVEAWALKTGAVGIRLNSGGSRSGAHEFYRRIGFDDEKMQIRFIRSI